MPSAINNPSLTIKPLHSTFVAEVQGVPWEAIPLPHNIIEEIRAAADEYGVLVFRKANLNNEEHIRFSQQLGDLMDVKAHIAAGRKMRYPDQPEIFDVSNLDDKGNIVTSADPARKEGNKGNFLWHADMTYDPQRAKYSILRAVELPPKGTGGETKYLDSRTAYADLLPETKDEIEHLVTHNSLFHNRKTAAPEFFSNVDPTQHPMSRYRIVYPHEGSHRKNLYLTTYAWSIDGKTREESIPIFDRLWEHLVQDKYIYTAHWENNGDMILWDNTAVLHKATDTGSYAEKFRRDMRRTSTKDGESTGGARMRWGRSGGLGCPGRGREVHFGRRGIMVWESMFVSCRDTSQEYCTCQSSSIFNRGCSLY